MATKGKKKGRRLIVAESRHLAGVMLRRNFRSRLHGGVLFARPRQYDFRWIARRWRANQSRSAAAATAVSNRKETPQKPEAAPSAKNLGLVF